jgi:hypothetical protein
MDQQTDDILRMVAENAALRADVTRLRTKLDAAQADAAQLGRLLKESRDEYRQLKEDAFALNYQWAEAQAEAAEMRQALRECADLIESTDWGGNSTWEHDAAALAKKAYAALATDAGAKVLRVVEAARKVSGSRGFYDAGSFEVTSVEKKEMDELDAALADLDTKEAKP